MITEPAVHEAPVIAFQETKLALYRQGVYQAWQRSPSLRDLDQYYQNFYH